MKEIQALDKISQLPEYRDFPDIELYMDQVLEFLSRSKTQLRDDEKISAAMINNYIKADALPRAQGKRYSRDHLVRLMVLQRLKQVLSVKDAANLIRSDSEQKTNEEFYNHFLETLKHSTKSIQMKLEEQQALTEVALLLAIDSYLSKITCEYLIDLILTENPEE